MDVRFYEKHDLVEVSFTVNELKIVQNAANGQITRWSQEALATRRGPLGIIDRLGRWLVGREATADEHANLNTRILYLGAMVRALVDERPPADLIRSPKDLPPDQTIGTLITGNEASMLEKTLFAHSHHTIVDHPDWERASEGMRAWEMADQLSFAIAGPGFAQPPK